MKFLVLFFCFCGVFGQEGDKYAKLEAAARELVEDVVEVSNKGYKVKPGEVIHSTEQNDITRALDDLKDDISWLDGKACSVAIANLGNLRLLNPRYWLRAGDIVASPPKYIDAEKTGLVLFARKFISLTGTEGVLIYEIDDSEFNLALMWSVPLDDLLFNGMKFNFKIYPRSVKPCRKLFWQMHDWAGAFKTTGYHKRTEYGITMHGSMTDNKKSRITLYFATFDYNRKLGPSLNFWCETKGVIGKKCRKECSPYGKCWTDRKCKKDRDCNSGMTCAGKC